MINLFKKIKNIFSVKISISHYLYNHRTSLPFFNRAIVTYKHNVLKQYIYREYKHVFDNANKTCIPEKNSCNTMWVLWWDGYDEMPDIVKLCYRSIQKYSQNVKLITKHNYSEYVELPSYIKEKFDSNIISIQQLSDILRVCILSDLGGFWVDSTILFTSPFLEVNRNLFTIKHGMQTDFVSNGRWTGFFIGGYKGHILFVTMREIFFEYWKNNNRLIDYLLIDYLIAVCYERIDLVRNDIDNIPLNNNELYKLQPIFDDLFSFEFYRNITLKTNIHKLNWRVTPKNKDTYYTYLKKAILNVK